MIFYYFGLYKGMWRYTSIKDLENIIKASFISSACIIVFILSIHRFIGYPRSVFFIDCLLTIFLISGVRVGIRLIFAYMKKEVTPWRNNKNGFNKRKKVLIVGAGDAGEKTLREINSNKNLLNYEVTGFLDDDPRKMHRYIHGVQVLDTIDAVTSREKELNFDEIIITIPSISGEEMRRIVNLCRKTGVKCKTIPSIGELIDGKVSLANIRDISYSDLLGRSQVKLDLDQIGEYLKGQCVLITGAGGSIGSEFCRQMGRFEPEKLVILDQAESNLYDIEMELTRLFPAQAVAPVLG